jgi:hypothetical protein
MHIKKLTSWILLAFVVLFWNLGPSLHHADIFGFHSANPEMASSCCCCSLSHPVVPDSRSSAVIENHGHCSLCDFFDQLHVTFDVESDSQTIQFGAFAELPSSQTADCESIAPQARGPPRA